MSDRERAERVCLRFVWALLATMIIYFAAIFVSEATGPRTESYYWHLSVPFYVLLAIVGSIGMWRVRRAVRQP